jgi:hypothetical protein
MTTVGDRPSEMNEPLPAKHKASDHPEAAPPLVILGLDPRIHTQAYQSS